MQPGANLGQVKLAVNPNEPNDAVAAGRNRYGLGAGAELIKKKSVL